MKRAAQPWAQKNRSASALRNDGVVIGERTLKDGTVLRGIYAARDFAPGDFVSSYHGRVISKAERLEIGRTNQPLFKRINEYGLGRDVGECLFEDRPDVVGAHLINHSCGPNAEWSGSEHGAVLVRATKSIAKGEEITIHYGWLGVHAAMHESWHPCECGARLCAGTIELKLDYYWADEAKTIGAPGLSVEQARDRFMCDLFNDVDDNERLFETYLTQGGSRALDAQEENPIDREGVFNKLEAGAREAMRRAKIMAAKGYPYSFRRMAQIERRYGSGETLVSTSGVHYCASGACPLCKFTEQVKIQVEGGST